MINYLPFYHPLWLRQMWAARRGGAGLKKSFLHQTRVADLYFMAFSCWGTLVPESHRKYPESSELPVRCQRAGDGGWALSDVDDGKDNTDTYAGSIRSILKGRQEDLLLGSVCVRRHQYRH